MYVFSNLVIIGFDESLKSKATDVAYNIVYEQEDGMQKANINN